MKARAIATRSGSPRTSALLGGALGTGADWDASYISLDVLSRNAEPAVVDLRRRHRARHAAAGRTRARARRAPERHPAAAQRAGARSPASASPACSTAPARTATPSSATPDSVARITIDDVRRFYEQHYLPNNSSVVVSGDIDVRARDRAGHARPRRLEAGRGAAAAGRHAASDRRARASTSSIARRPCSRRSASATSACRARARTTSRCR